jgi:peptide/nickel transport system substrate-binding protein
MALVKDIAVVDSTTLKFTLNEPWTSFQYALASEASMIPSPTAIKKACTEPAKAANTCTYNLAPVGAGPFMVTSYKPDDVINMVRNPNYWNGPVYLDGINFLDSGDTGGPAVLEKITAGTAQAGFLRDPLAVDEARKAKIPGIVTPSYNGWIILINGGASVNCVGGAPAPLCVGKPDGPTPSNPVTKDIKVRQAIAAAIDPRVVNDRAFGGTAQAGSELFQSTFPWDPKVSGPKYDVEVAKKLVAEAKAAGWNGNVRLACTSSQSGNNTALAVQTMLQAAGMTVDVSMGVGTATQLAVTTTKDFDLACWGLAIGPDHSALWALAQNLASNSASNRVGFNSPTVDQALRDLRVAKSDGDRTTAFKKIAEEVAAKIPWATLNSNEEYNAYSPKLHGLVGSNRSIVFFDKAWLE